MISQPDLSIVKEITQGLNTKIIGRNLFYFKEIESTNLYAKKLVESGVEEGIVVVSETQSKGRGRKNRTWSSSKGGLWFSIVLYPKILPKYGMTITMASSIAVAEGIKKITGLTPEIKWPNDILINGKKVCGILTENVANLKKINYSIVGIGINVNNYFESGLKKIATSLKIETSKGFSLIKLLKYVLKSFDEKYSKINFGDYESIRSSWLYHSHIIGKKIQVQGEKKAILGKVIDVDDCGCLILETTEGNLKINNGEIKFL